jgi:hypothetical protein
MNICAFKEFFKIANQKFNITFYFIIIYYSKIKLFNIFHLSRLYILNLFEYHKLLAFVEEKELKSDCCSNKQIQDNYNQEIMYQSEQFH